MYYPSSTTYTTQSYRKFKKQEDKTENTNVLQDYHILRTQKQIEQLQKELEHIRLEHQTSEKQRRSAEEKLYKFQLKYGDMSKECLNLREKIVKLEGEKAVIKAQGEGEIKALNYQIQLLETKKELGNVGANQVSGQYQKQINNPVDNQRNYTNQNAKRQEEGNQRIMN